MSEFLIYRLYIQLVLLFINLYILAIVAIRYFRLLLSFATDNKQENEDIADKAKKEVLNKKEKMFKKQIMFLLNIFSFFRYFFVCSTIVGNIQ